MKEHRLRNGISRLEIADHLNLSQSAIRGYESGAREIKPIDLLKMARFYGTTTDELLGNVVEKMGED